MSDCPGYVKRARNRRPEVRLALIVVILQAVFK